MKISILGCGWLGLELGRTLTEKNHEVRGSVTSMEKMADLRAARIIPYTIKIFRKGIQGDLKSFLSGAEVLIVDIPPGLRKNPEADFVKKIRSLIPYVEKAQLKKVVFVSSTSVYEDAEDFPTYTETSKTSNNSKRAIQLHNAELLFLNNDKINASVVRFGGLIGPNRHPVTHLSGKTDVLNPQAPVNLVHQKDCIAAILSIMEKDKKHSIWNVVYPEHPEKQEYYKNASEKKNIAPPEFDRSQASKGKIISSEKLIKELKFQFQEEI